MCIRDSPLDGSPRPQGKAAKVISLKAKVADQLVQVAGEDSARIGLDLVRPGAEPMRTKVGHDDAQALGGMGLQGLQDWERRKHFFLEAIDKFDTSHRGDPYWLAIQFMRTMQVDRIAAAHLLESFEDAPGEWLGAFSMPTLVVCGSEDQDNGSAAELADALPDGRLVEVPGTHMSSVTREELGEAVARFLAE